MPQFEQRTNVKFFQKFCRKHPELCRIKTWLLLCENAPEHRSLLVQEELTRQQVFDFPHPLYSPDLAPYDYFFIPRLWSHIKLGLHVFFLYIVFSIIKLNLLFFVFISGKDLIFYFLMVRT